MRLALGCTRTSWELEFGAGLGLGGRSQTSGLGANEHEGGSRALFKFSTKVGVGKEDVAKAFWRRGDECGWQRLVGKLK